MEQNRIWDIKRKSKVDLLDAGKPYATYYDEEGAWLDTSGTVPFLRFACMEQHRWLQMVFSTRLGGVSKGYLSSLNLGWDRGDTRETVCENYRRVCQSMGVDYTRLVLSDQVHDIQVVYADESLCGGEKVEKKVQGIDGLMTDIPGLVLATSYADCVPLFFVDPVTHMIGASHSGWKGTVAHIGQETIRQMEQRGCNRENIHVLVGPSICQDCYEVSDDVIRQFQQKYPEQQWEQIYRLGKVTNQGEQKYQLDLWAANWYQFDALKMPHEHIHVAGICTCCNADLLYSHRASHGKRGNLNGFITICD